MTDEKSIGVATEAVAFGDVSTVSTSEGVTEVDVNKAAVANEEVLEIEINATAVADMEVLEIENKTTADAEEEVLAIDVESTETMDEEDDVGFEIEYDSDDESLDNVGEGVLEDTTVVEVVVKVLEKEGGGVAFSNGS